MRVLIVERGLAARTALRLFLEVEAGASVVGEAASQDEVIGAIVAFRPDVVILDWAMPGIGAILDSVMTGERPRVIAMSSRPEARREAILAGADAFVCKCDPPERIAQTLASLALPTAVRQTSLAAAPETR